MQDKKKSMVFYRSFLDAVEEMPETSQLPLMKAIIKYALDGITPDNLDDYCRPVFKAIQPTIDEAIQRYQKNKENGQLGGRPKKGDTQTDERKRPKTANEILAELNYIKT